MVDAISPSNFWMTNPAVLRETMATGGENLIKGLENLLEDLERGGGQLRVSMSDDQAFQVGKNLATTPGRVVYQNRLIQLIQYEPMTPTVHKVPLLILPPWINKYYILDLNEKKSFIRYLVSEGHTVFCVSWVTYLVTMIDFSEPGDLGVFIDDEQISSIENRMASMGYLDAASMSTTFNLLRSNDLIWSFVVNNYLLGKEPFPFDILYWNADSTNLPSAMHSFYLRQMYLHNDLVKPQGMAMKGVPIDVRTITTPSFLLSTSEDHIAPWKSTYAGTQLYKGTTRFVLSGSGHIAGVVNPP